MAFGTLFRKKSASVLPVDVTQSADASTVQSSAPGTPSSAGSIIREGIYKEKTPWLKTVHRPDLILRHIHKQCRARGWTTNDTEPSVVIRTGNQVYQEFPESVADESNEKPSEYLIIAEKLRCEILLLARSRLLTRFISQLHPAATMVPLAGYTNIQVIDTLDNLSVVRNGHHAAFVREPALLLIWQDTVSAAVPYAEEIEEKMVNSLWQASEHKEKDFTITEIHETDSDGASLELGGVPESRPDCLIISCLIALAIILLFWFSAVNIKKIVIEVMVDHSYARLGLILYVPLTFLWSAFFAIVIIGFIFQVFGPIAQLTTNSKYYSALPPKRIKADFPPITIQCPVYKEDLEHVIMPTVASLRQAVATYEMQGGVANIFFNDDGMQLLTEEEQTLRKEFYRANNIGWIARPPHGQDGFVRAGRFKKASNMNYALHVSMLVEDALDAQENEGLLLSYENALSTAIDKTKELGPLAWAAGEVRMGEIILLVDSDTRVPADCLLDAASEFTHEPALAILQHSSGVMQVVHDFWENGITHFTRGIYFAIRYACASGDASPFVGHNAFLRWSAIQEIAYQSADDTRNKWWSEDHVSEDFEMSLKIQMKGYIVRLAAYANDEFKEGVSLTVYDELARWQKYSYGCSELVFNPLKVWFKKGPITPLFRMFLRSNMKSFAKFTMIAYISTYYAISAGSILTLANYFIIGWFVGSIDHFYVQSFDVFIAVVFVFNVWPIFNAFVRFRVKEAGFFRALVENYKWGLMMSIFMGGLGVHLTSALIAHLFSINVNWGSTNKTLDSSSFSREIPKIWKQFKYLYIGLFLLVVMMIALAFFVPEAWRIQGLLPCICLGWLITSHALLPVALNPQSYLSELHS